MKTYIYGICAVVGVLLAAERAEAVPMPSVENAGAGCGESTTPAETTATPLPDSTTLKGWRQAALDGDAAACKVLGRIWADPSEQFVPRNLRAALNWYLRAACTGDSEAQRLAGEAWLMLSDELEEPRPFETAAARYWLQRAAEQGDAEARVALEKLASEEPASAAAALPGDPKSPDSLGQPTPDAAPPMEAPAPAGRTAAWPGRPDDYARLLNAFDTAAAHGTQLMTPQDPKLGVVVNRSRFEELRNRILAGDDYGAPTYRAALDSLQAHHQIRTFDDMGMDYMLFKVKSYYDNRQIDWGPARETAPGRYEMTDLDTRFEYVVEQRDGRWSVYRKASGDFSDSEPR